MRDYLLPLLLSMVGLLSAFATYRGIRRGGARFYTLEREAILRRASLTLLASVALFLGAVGVLIYERQELATVPDGAVEVEEGEDVEPAGTPVLQTSPPTETPTPPVAPSETPTATPIVCRAVVEGTGGNGLTLRDAPNGLEIVIIAEGSIVTMMEEEAEETAGFVWRRVRLIGGEEGWVAQEFLTFRAQCQ